MIGIPQNPHIILLLPVVVIVLLQLILILLRLRVSFIRWNTVPAAKHFPAFSSSSLWFVFYSSFLLLFLAFSSNRLVMVAMVFISSFLYFSSFPAISTSFSHASFSVLHTSNRSRNTAISRLLHITRVTCTHSSSNCFFSISLLFFTATNSFTRRCWSACIRFICICASNPTEGGTLQDSSLDDSV